MSEFDLTIGNSYDNRRNNLCLAHLHSLGLVKKRMFGGYTGENARWAETHGNGTTISILNLATVCTFYDFVSDLLEQPSKKLMFDELFGNLPWWMDSIWVPVNFSQHKAFTDDPDGPFFLGSIPRLIVALTEIKKKSQLPMGEVPPSYDLMRRDPQAFYREFQGLKDNNECIQWVWRGLYDAATIAEQEHLSLLGCG